MTVERVGVDMFTYQAYAAIFSELTTQAQDAPVDAIAAGLDEDATEVLHELLDENGGLENAEEAIGGSIRSLLSREGSQRLAELDRVIPLAEGEEKDRLIEEKKTLAALMRASGHPIWKQFKRKPS